MTPRPRVWQRLLRRPVHTPTQAPLLGDDEIARLLAQGARIDLLAGAPASAFVAGDLTAARAGSGIEFDDNRPYSAGDDARYINWRLTARAGSTYTKVFREEHRPCGFILLDRRAAMRFATVGRLKVTQGASAAVLFGASAQQRGAPLGALLLDAAIHWLEPLPGRAALLRLASAAAAPAPPLDGAGEPTLGEALKQIAVRLPPGCEVLLISDFVDLCAADAATLVRLADAHRLRALCVRDPAESNLPAAGPLQLTAAGGGASLTVDSAREDVRRRFAELAGQQQQQLADWFAGAGIPWRVLSTADACSVSELAPPWR